MGSLLGGVAAIVIAELVLWAAGTTPHVHVVFHGKFQLSNNPVLGYELQPGSRDGTNRISRAGLRDREYPLRKPDHVFRVVVLGDSVTFGHRLARAESYPKQLEKLLHRYAGAASPDFEVLNFGVTGYNITQSIENLRVNGLPYEPDLVIYGYVLNDPQAFSLEAEALAALQRRSQEDLIEHPPWTDLPILRSSRLLTLVTTLARKHRVLQNLPYLVDPGFRAYHTNSHVEYFQRLHEEDVSWARVSTGLSDIAAMTSKPRRVPVLVAVFPINERNGATNYLLLPLHDQVIAAARQNGLDTLDLTSAIRAASVNTEEELFLDFLHPTAHGNRVVAIALLKWLSESGYVPAGGVDFARLQKSGKKDATIAAALTAAAHP